MTQALPTDTPPARIAIVDDHPMVAEGIEAILDGYDDLTVVTTLSCARKLIEGLDSFAPDVIVMDLNMPGMGGLEATEMILERAVAPKVLILSMHDGPEYVSSALSHGASGYVLKDASSETFKIAIDAVLDGQVYLCPGAQKALKPSENTAREALTGREQTVLLQLAQGKSNKQVAASLDISVRTVETHRKNIKRKLDISTTAGLTRYALEHGVLQGSGRFDRN